MTQLVTRACSADALYVDDRAEAQRLLAGEVLSGPEGPGSRTPAMTVVVPSADVADCVPDGSRHRLIVPLPGDSRARVVLEAVDSDLVTQVLQAAGENTHAAYEFGALARMSLLALRRRLAVQPELCRPSWAGGHIDSTVRRSLLLAGWNETHEGDRCIVERFAGCPYDRVTEALHTLDTGDAPMILTDASRIPTRSRRRCSRAAPTMTRCSDPPRPICMSLRRSKRWPGRPTT